MPNEQIQNQDPSVSQEIDVDLLMSGIESQESHEREIPMTRDEAPEQKNTQTQPTQTTDIEFVGAGKQIKAPITDPRIKQWLSQGYDYAQRMQEVNQRLSGWEQERKQYEDTYGKYKTVDDYIQKNPQWWDHVTKSWETREQVQDPNNPWAQEFNSLKQELQDLKQFKQQSIERDANQQREVEDHNLQGEIQSVREQYKDLDWANPGEDGKSMEVRIVEHAIKNKIPSFKTAFLDFNHDRLIKLAEERGKELVNKDIQKKTKLGLLGQSPTPKKGITDSENVKSKSYEQILAETLEEIRQGA